CGDGEVGMLLLIGRAYFLQQAFAPQRLELRRDGGDDVRGGTAGAALGERAAENDLGAGAPVIHFDAVAPHERLDQLVRVFGRERRIEEQRSLFLRALDQALRTVRAAVER